VPTTDSCAGIDATPAASNLELIRTATECLINIERARAGLEPLRPDGRLQVVAQAHSADMVARDYFEHTTPSGVTAMRRILDSGFVPAGAGYAIGENIAFGTGVLATPREIVQAWMHSTEHRDNILSPGYRSEGMGVVPAVPAQYATGQDGAIYTQDFGAVA